MNRCDLKSFRAQDWALEWQAKSALAGEHSLSAPSKIFPLGKLWQARQLTLQEKEKTNSNALFSWPLWELRRLHIQGNVLTFSVSRCCHTVHVYDTMLSTATLMRRRKACPFAKWRNAILFKPLDLFFKNTLVKPLRTMSSKVFQSFVGQKCHTLLCLSVVLPPTKLCMFQECCPQSRTAGCHRHNPHIYKDTSGPRTSQSPTSHVLFRQEKSSPRG